MTAYMTTITMNTYFILLQLKLFRLGTLNYTLLAWCRIQFLNVKICFHDILEFLFTFSNKICFKLTMKKKHFRLIGFLSNLHGGHCNRETRTYGHDSIAARVLAPDVDSCVLGLCFQVRYEVEFLTRIE